MNLEESLAFLAAHQPMEDDPSEEKLSQLNEAVAFFFENPDELCIPLFLNLFGKWDDLETYDSIQWLLRKFPAAVVRPHLKQALSSPFDQVRLWSLDLARYFADESLLPYLAKALKEEEPLIRIIAAAVLESIASPAARKMAKQLLLTETEDDVREILESI